MVSGLIQIGQAGQQTGLSVDAIRFYEKERLLKHPSRSAGGFRLFSADDVQKMLLIRRAQELGFSLREIRELLILEGEHVESCSHVSGVLREKLQTVRTKIAQLQQFERELSGRVRECERSLKTTIHKRDRCPVLREMARPPGAANGNRHDD